MEVLCLASVVLVTRKRPTLPGPTGIAISRKSGMIPLQMELGGKDVCIVCADADLDLAGKSIVKGAFSYSGQRCTAVKLVMVLDTVGV